MRKYMFQIIILAYAFVLYGNTIGNGYSVDDDFVIYNNEMVQKGISAIPEIFSSSYSEGEGRTYGYRPIARVLFAIEYDIAGDNPGFSHFINILIYALSGIFLFYLLRRLMSKYPEILPFLIVILFMSHPLHTEVVASLKNREEMLAMIGGLASLYFCMKFTSMKRIWYLIPAMLFFSVAYLSKESVLVFVAIVPLALYFFTDMKLSNVLVVMLVLFLAFRLTKNTIDTYITADRAMQFYENPLVAMQGISPRLILGLQTLFKYISLMVIPHPLVFYYGYNTIPLTGWGDYKVLLSLLIHLGLFITALAGIKKKTVLSFGILVYLAAVAVFSNVLVDVSGIVGERLVYIASLGFCIAVCALIYHIATGKKKETKLGLRLILPVILIALPYTGKTITRNSDWEDTMTLVHHDMAYLEQSARAKVFYAGLLMYEIRENPAKYSDNKKREMVAEAEKQYLAGLEIYPGYLAAQKALGNIYYSYYRDYNKAIQWYTKLVENDSLNKETWLNLGYAYESVSNKQGAESCYLEVIEIDSSNIQARSLLANLFYGNGNPEKALALNNEIMAIDSTTDIPYINLGNYSLLEADTAGAVKYWEKAIEIVPGNKNLLYGLVRYFEQTGNETKAAYYKQLLKQIQ
ncbi:MAG: hypothetical protein ABIJ16_11850 [Bacteroidota bacterium]